MTIKSSILVSNPSKFVSNFFFCFVCGGNNRCCLTSAAMWPVWVLKILLNIVNNCIRYKHPVNEQSNVIKCCECIEAIYGDTQKKSHFDPALMDGRIQSRNTTIYHFGFKHIIYFCPVLPSTPVTPILNLNINSWFKKRGNFR